MTLYPPPAGCPHFEQTLAPFLAGEGLPFAAVLPAHEVERAFAEAGVAFGATPKSIFTLALTLGAFLSQVLDEAKSCRAAVLRIAALLLALERGPCAEDTAAYCRARAKLRCRTPALLEREIWAHFLGYNLVRPVSAQAAQAQGVHPRGVSFTASKQAVNAARGQLTRAGPAERVRQGKALLKVLGTAPVGDRPDRCEPRALTRRPKEYDRLMKPRAAARAAALQAAAWAEARQAGARRDETA